MIELDTNHVVGIWREPMSLGTPSIWRFKPGMTLHDIVEKRKSSLPDDFNIRGVICINNQVVPRDFWGMVKPKPHSKELPIYVTFHKPMQGGGGDRKNVFGIVALLAISAAAIATGAGALVPLLGEGFATGTLGAQLAAAGVSVVGSLIVGALSSTPSLQAISSDQPEGGGGLDPASAEGNILEQNAPLPRVIGTRRVFPPFMFEPTIELVNQDEYIDAVYGLAGPHNLEEIELGGSSVDLVSGTADATINVQSGLPTDDPISLPQRYSRTLDINLDMSTHGVDPEDEDQFIGPLPVWHGMSTTDSPDECWLHMFNYGLIRQADFNEVLIVPFRVRMRLKGSPTWRYLPEFHYAGKTQSQSRFQIKFIFGNAFGGTPAVPLSNRGWVEARKHAPGQDVSPSGPDFDADSYFSSGAGGDVYSSSGSGNVENISMTVNTVNVFLDITEWTQGVYEIEIIRGAFFRQQDYNQGNYTINGNVLDFFGSRSTGEMPFSRENVIDRMHLRRLVNVRNGQAIDQKNLALIHVRARNRTVDRLSVLASGYVNDYNAGSETWTDVVTTSNPAPHYRDILTGTLNLDSLPDILVDDESLITWRQRCIDNDYTCDLVVEGTAITELLRVLAACGFARPYQSELWGVIEDYDRSAESPIQIFSARTINNLSFEKTFARIPAGFRVNFDNEDNGYGRKQLTVYRQNADETDARTEQIKYDGLVKEDHIIRRAEFDLKQLELRSSTYHMLAPITNIVCRRGSLVGVNHDVLLSQYGYARIKSVILG